MDSSDVPELSEGIQASIERGLDCFWRWPTCMQRLFPFHVVTHSAALFLLRESHRLFSRILPYRESTVSVQSRSKQHEFFVGSPALHRNPAAAGDVALACSRTSRLGTGRLRQPVC